MPQIASINNIIKVAMFYAPKEHNPKHIHVYYKEYSAKISIENYSIIAGIITPKQHESIREWVKIIKYNCWKTGIWLCKANPLRKYNTCYREVI
ncbi:MAG: DUF4160 domain-containing protein [Clostridia bacterium]